MSIFLTSSKCFGIIAAASLWREITVDSCRHENQLVNFIKSGLGISGAGGFTLGLNIGCL